MMDLFSGIPLMRRLVFSLVFPLCLALPITACQSVPAARIQVNPNPTGHQGVVIETDNLPGRPTSVEADVGYRIANEACIPLTPFSGATLNPRQYVPIRLTDRGAGRWEGRFEVDHFADGNYWNQGVCRWEVESINATLKDGVGATHASLGMTRFQEGEETSYFVARSWGSGLDDTGTNQPMPGGFSITVRLTPP
jgi:hypothetical protein